MITACQLSADFKLICQKMEVNNNQSSGVDQDYDPQLLFSDRKK